MNEEDIDKPSKQDLDVIVSLVKALILVLLLSLFGNFLLGLIDKYFVDKIVYPIYKDRLNVFETFITLIASFYCLYLILAKIATPKYQVSSNAITLMTVPLLMYLNERWLKNDYVFTKILDEKKFDVLRLLDFPFGLLAMAIAILIINRLKDVKAKPVNDLIIDLPLTLLEQDRFERRQVYESLINQISSISYEENRSFSVGIVNKWAEGKTSFLNLIKEELKKDDENTIVVTFNAWFTSQSDNLTNDFFNTLDEALSKYIYTGSLIRRYANSLTQINSIYNPAKYIPQHFIAEKTNQNFFDKIEKLLQRLDKRIFVIIDDIDRLDNKEVFNLLRVIRNSADFSYIIFLVPYDKDYLIHALNENKIYKPKEYIKKIFDLEISLTPIYEGYLQPIVSKILDEFVGTKLVNATANDIEKLKEQINGISSSIGVVNSGTPKYATINSVLFKIIRNNRDIIRFTNSIKLSLKHNFNKLYLPDLIILELIKYENLETYRKLFENRNYLKVSTKDERKVLELFEDNEKSRSEIFDFLNGNVTNFNILTELGDDDIKKLVQALFDQPETKDYNSKLSIYYDVNYLNYIQYNIMGISYDDLDKIIMHGEVKN